MHTSRIFTFLFCVLLSQATAWTQSSYTWTGSIDSIWTTSGNWSPARITPTINDILIFDGTQANQPKLAASETIGRISVVGDTKLTIANGTATVVLTATGGSPFALSVASGVTLTVNSTGTTGNGQISIGVNGGRIFGTITIQGLTQILATDASNQLQFDVGSVFNASQTAGNPFGASPVADAVRFKNNSTFNHNSGSNPFALAPPSTAVIFDVGSTYIFNFSGGTSAFISSGGRHYGNVVFAGSTPFTYDQGSGKEWVVNGSLTINPGITLDGGTVTSQPQIAGDLINNGIWTASSAIDVLLNGTAVQAISGGGTYTLPGGLTINNTAGVALQRALVMSGALNFTSGNLSLGNNILTLGGVVNGAGPGKCVLTNGTGAVARAMTGGTSFQFPVGATATDFNPLTLNLGALDPADTFSVHAASGINPSTSIAQRAVQCTWTVTEATPGGNNVALTFQWDGSQEGATFNRAKGLPWHFNGTDWSQFGSGPTAGTDPYTLTDTIRMSTFAPMIVASDLPVSSVAPKSLAFGSVSVGLSRIDSVLMKNTGASSLAITSIVSSDNSFNVTPTAATIASQDSLRFYVTFVPASPGAKTGTIVFSSNTAIGKDTVTATGNGAPGLATLAHARIQPLGTEVLVEGVITRTMGSYTRIQDSTAAIVVRQTTGAFFDSVSGGGLVMGDRIRIDGKLSSFNNLLQIDSTDLVSFERLSRNNALPVPKVLTLAQIAGGGEQYESQLITVRGLTIIAGPDNAFAPAKTYQITDVTDVLNDVSLRIGDSTDTQIDGKPILKTPVTFTGVLSQLSSIDTAKGYQLVPVLTTDITDNVLSVGRTVGVPREYGLFNNYPNPFNPSTTIRYQLPVASHVSLKVYNILGQEVATLVDELKQAGVYEVHFDGSGLASGLYLYRMQTSSSSRQAGEFVATRRLILLK